MNRKAYILSGISIVGSILIATWPPTWVMIVAYCCYLVSNIGFLAMCLRGSQSSEQKYMWMVNVVITVLGLLTYSEVLQ
jgi:hypothetical protein